MLTVIELLSHPVFGEDFRLVSSRSGLYNQVRDSGIFEWENEEKIAESFHQGDFIITTLAAFKDDPERAKELVKVLIRRKLSALCIKDVYFKEIPEDLISLADEYKVPLFLFSETYFDDIIFTIKNTLAPDDINSSNIKKIRRILYEDMDDLEIEITAKELNPFFHNNIICGFFIPRDREEKYKAVNDYFTNYKLTINPRSKAEQQTYSVTKFSNGIGIIFTGDSSPEDLRDEFLNFLPSLEIDTKKYALGIGDPTTGLFNLGTAFREAIYASIDCDLTETETKEYKNSGLIQFIGPLRHNYWITSFYERILDRITEYDHTHNSRLLDTLIAYVDCGGDIAKTAEKTFQHSNTIRYRMDKIFKVLELEKAHDRMSQIYVFVCIHKIKDTMRDTRI